MDETGRPGDRDPAGGGSGMVAPPSARRLDGDSWAAPTGDDTFEALVSSWSEADRDHTGGLGSSVSDAVSGRGDSGRGDHGPVGLPGGDSFHHDPQRAGAQHPDIRRSEARYPDQQYPDQRTAAAGAQEPNRGEQNGRNDADGRSQLSGRRASQSAYADVVSPVSVPMPTQYQPVHPPGGHEQGIPAQGSQSAQEPTAQYRAPASYSQVHQPQQPPQSRSRSIPAPQQQAIVVPQPATVPIPPEALVRPDEHVLTGGAGRAGAAPTNGAPVSGAPTSGAPTSGAPVSGAPVSGAPISGAPVSGAPISGAPVSGAPVSGTVISGAPVSGVPISGAPMSGAPVSGAPTSDALPRPDHRHDRSQPRDDSLWHPANGQSAPGTPEPGAPVQDWATLPDWATEHPIAAPRQDYEAPLQAAPVAGQGLQQNGSAAAYPGGQPAQMWPPVGQAGAPPPGSNPGSGPSRQGPGGSQPPPQPHYNSPYREAPLPDPAALRYIPVPDGPRTYQTDEGSRHGLVHHNRSSVGLPVRVPARPDVPDLPGPGGSATDPEDPADAPDLDRIADYLSRAQTSESTDDWRPDGFDIPAVIEAVRGVPGVREALVRPNPNGVHTLRLELADDADPAEVSRAVARLLKERMGLATEEPNQPSPLATTPAPSRVQPTPSLTAPYPREARRRRANAPLAQPRADDPWVDDLAPADPLASDPLIGETLAGEPPVWQPDTVAVTPFARESVVSPFEYGDDTGATASDERTSERGGVRLYPRTIPAPRAVIDQVTVRDEGGEAVVEVRLTVADRVAIGVANGPAFDGYVLRVAATATGAAIDRLLDRETGPRGRCFVEHATTVSLGGGCDVAVVVALLAGDGWVEQLTGSAVVAGDPRYAVVRATLAAVNRRLEGLL